VALAVLHVAHLVPAAAARLEQQFGQFEVGQLGAAADVVDLTGGAAGAHQVHAAAVVLDVQPVAYVLAVAVQRYLAGVEQARDEQRNDLLGELPGAVVVAATGDPDVQAVCAVVGEGDEIGGCLGRRIR
jgi:hypothetical protein